MAGGVEGDFDSFDDLIDGFDGMSSLASDAADRAATSIQAMARAGYASGTDPYGSAWKPRKKDGAVALQRPAAAIEFTVMGESTITAVGESVLAYHQKNDGDNTPRLPRRMTLPEPGRPMPDAWDKAISDAVEAELDNRLGGQ